MCHRVKRAVFLRVQSLIRHECNASLWHAPLWLLSQCFRGVICLRNALYDRSFLRSTRMKKAIVVSIGNLVAGGTGKTPLVHLLAEMFATTWRVAIVTRGYGGWQKVGDEALLVARRLPQVKVYAHRRRVQAAQRAEKEGCHLLLLDDGFQHRALARDLDCLLLHTEDLSSPSSLHYLPRGFLRDAPQRVARADVLFLYPIPIAEESVWQQRFPHAVGLRLRLKRIVGMHGETMSSLAEKKWGVFAGIARPHLFQKEVERLGGQVISGLELLDHEPVGVERLQRWANHCVALGAEALVCTEKDWVKIPQGLSLPLPLFYLEMEMEIVFGVETWKKCIAQIEQKLNTEAHLCNLK